MTQHEIVLSHIRKNGSISTFEAMMDHGINRLAARIHELKAKGYDFETEVKTNKVTGKRYARYSFKSHGLLENWKTGWGVIYGEIHADAKGRWPDGTPIHTSSVLRIHGLDPSDGGPVTQYATTRNSIYRLGTPAPEPKSMTI